MTLRKIKQLCRYFFRYFQIKQNIEVTIVQAMMRTISASKKKLFLSHSILLMKENATVMKTDICELVHVKKARFRASKVTAVQMLLVRSKKAFNYSVRTYSSQANSAVVARYTKNGHPSEVLKYCRCVNHFFTVLIE